MGETRHSKFCAQADNSKHELTENKVTSKGDWTE